MAADFEMIHNFHERAVIQAVRDAVHRYPQLQHASELFPDIACVALNRLPPRYIRHEVDFSFFLSDKERADNETAITAAVDFAVEFVQARMAMRARR
ncbi:MAG: late competence development ComFB family protein [Pseudomonadota bacterium]